MSAARLLLLRIVTDCFQSAKSEVGEKSRGEGMHCLGAGAGDQSSPSGFGSRGSVLSVVRALGVLVCEGRIQGPPRGYKEGPHCVAPLQSTPNNHLCEKDNYLCDRYLVLVREITERVTTGAYLCVEVVLCSDCPCGLIKSKSKHRVVSQPTAPSWQQSSEMLLEYWCIGIVSSKSQEMMNSQGLYQAVRSRLHFSQVAAWWSRTNGANPSYVATRIVQQMSGDDHLRRFREPPVEHTFPLATVGDGNSVKVTVWALPRMEDIPRLQCPMHPLPQHQPEDASDSSARASTPTKLVIPTTAQPSSGAEVAPSPAAPSGLVMPGKFTKTVAPSSAPFPPSHKSVASGAQPASPAADTFVYYMSSFRSAALLDDRLQIACDKPGKHHCRCADEEDDVEACSAAATSTLARPNGERKRRRSLPCRPPENNAGSPTAGQPDHPALPALKEATAVAPTSTVTSGSYSASDGVDSLERTFRTQLSIEEQQECCANHEKRYKRSESLASSTSHKQEEEQQQQTAPENNAHVPLFVPWVSYSANGAAISGSLPLNNTSSTGTNNRNTMNLVLNPFCSADGEQPAKINSSVHQQAVAGKKPVTTVHLDDWKKDKESTGKIEQGGIFDWFTRVPARVLGSNNNNNINNNNNNNNSEVLNVKTQTTATAAPSTTPAKCELKTRNGNLELSPREFDEVLAVLRARTPLGRRRAALRTAKRREKYDRLVNETQQQQQQQQQTSRSTSSSTTDASLYSNVSNKADVLLGAILRSSSKENDNRKSPADTLNGTKPTVAGSELPTMEDGGTKCKTSVASYCPESSGNVISPDCGESSLPSAFNKRLSRLRQLFKRDQEKLLTMSEDNGCSQYQQQGVQRDSRAKRRIDFSAEENGGEDESQQDEEDEDEEADEAHCDSSVGTSRNSAHVNSVFHSTNYDKRNGGSCCSAEPEQLDDEQQQHCKHVECCNADNGRTTPTGKNKTRGQRELPPIWVNHNNNHVSDATKSSKNANESMNGTKVEEDASDTSDKSVVPSAKDQERFRRSLENAASMVFHSRTGLPLTSSPAPLRRTGCCFDFDSSLNSVSSKRSALFELNTPPSPGAVSLEEGDRETENVCDTEEVTRRRSTSRNRPQSHALLGSFEESALNGRLEPVSTVHGFAAEIGASGSFCPKHRKLPVTVFFYTLGDNDKVSSPYLAHINLGKKGYQVPRSGTIQVTLLNPLGTVVKMFVVLYDLSDMPPRSHTFLRQRTLRDKTLRYLIHLRFMSGKSGRIYLHTDVRMIICRKADVDTASDFGSEPPKELRSYIHGPTNPKFSPRC